MKFSKYCIAIILFAAVTFVTIICNGVYILKERNYSCTFNVVDVRGVNAYELDKCAMKHDLILYARSETQLTLNDYEIIYYTDNPELVQKNIGLKNGVVRNFIEMNLHIKFSPLSQIENANAVERWTLIGNKDNIKSFASELNNTKFYTVTIFSGKHDMASNIPYILLWCTVFILLLYTYTDMTFQKKETAVSILHGASTATVYFKNVFSDLLVFNGIYIISLLLLRCYTMRSNFYGKMHYLMVLLSAGVILIYIPLMSFSAKEVIYGHQHSQHFMSILTALKNVLSIISCIVIIACISVAPSVTQYRKAEKFFQLNQDRMFFVFKYDYDIQENYENGNLDDIMEQRYLQKLERVNFCRETDETFQPICIADLSGSSVDCPSAFDAIYCNHRALSYIQTVVPETIGLNIQDYDCVLLISDNISEKEKDEQVSYLIEKFETFEGYKPNSNKINILNYSPSTQLLCFDYYNDFKFVYYTSPAVCIASDTYKREDAADLMINHDMLFHGMIYQVNNLTQLDTEFQSYSFSPIASNVYDKFKMDYRLQQVLLTLSVLLIILILVFYASVTYTLLQLDYQVNAVELAVKKIFGYTIIEKNSHYFTSSIALAGLNIVISFFILRKSHLYAAAIIPIFLLIMDTILLYIMIRKIERQQMVKILKGGAL